MKVVTKNGLSYKCKFVEYEGDNATLTLWSGIKETIKIDDIAYISLS